MSEQNKAVAKRFYDAWNARDLDAFDEIIAPDAVDHDAQNPFREMRGPGGVKRTAAMYHSAFSDGRFIVHEQIAEGHCVVTRWTGAGRSATPTTRSRGPAWSAAAPAWPCRARSAAGAS